MGYLVAFSHGFVAEGNGIGLRGYKPSQSKQIPLSACTVSSGAVFFPLYKGGRVAAAVCRQGDFWPVLPPFGGTDPRLPCIPYIRSKTGIVMGFRPICSHLTLQYEKTNFPSERWAGRRRIVAEPYALFCHARPISRSTGAC